MSMDVWCRHFNGIQHKSCRKGIAYATVRDDSQPGMVRLPCISSDGAATTCPHFAHYTQAEIDERNRAVNDYLTALSKFESRETENCPHCGKHVDSLRQVSRCVYGSCGCRMWQGRVPDAWKE